MDLVKIHTDAEFSNARIPDGQILTYISTDESGNVVTKFKDSEGNSGTIAGSGGSSEVNVTLGQINADGKFQPLSFNGTVASNSGNPETVENYYGFNGVLPVPESGGSSNGGDYYKCASVDTDNKTWTGYKAVLTDGVYSFEETVTEGLTYGTAFTPLINGIYNAEATINISGIWQGVPLADLFSADLIANTEASAPLSMQGNITFASKRGKQCAIFDGKSCLYNKTWSLSGPFSVSLSVYWESGSEPILGIGNHSANKNFELCSKNGGIPTIYVMYGADQMELRATSNIKGRWAHIVITFDGSTRQIYVDKVLENSGSVLFTGDKGIVLGSFYGNGTYDSFRDGYMIGGMRYVRVFNRVLTQDEINQLYIEQM